jgi:hypothetical protein
MAKIDLIVLRREVSETIKSSRKIKETARKVAEEKFNQAKEEMLKEFNEHPVTRELESGPDAEGNISRTLGGYGNLYSFIGFEEGQDPTGVVRKYIEENAKLKRNVRYIKAQDEFEFKAQIPLTVELEALTPSPWDGKSWVRGIERGISGLGYYIFSKIREFKRSRSGTAIQADSKIRDLVYKPVKYMSNIFNNFKKKMQ